MSALYAFRTGPKPIRLQLCVCLANLAVQMTEWKDVLPLVISKLGTNPEGITCVLDFIRVLPEEVTDGRKINLSVRIELTLAASGARVEIWLVLTISKL